MNTMRRVVLFVCVVVIAVLFVLLAFVRQFSADAVSGFIGVLAGGAIAGAIQYGISVADREHQLRTAALERRLQAHQEAYALWRRLIFSTSQEDLYALIRKSALWWDDNCLYLDPEARRAFYRAINAAGERERAVHIDDDPRIARLAWQDMEKAGDIIAKGVALPGFGKAEADRLDVPSTKKQESATTTDT